MSEQLDIFETSEKTEQENESDLTPRQKALYLLIQHNSLVEHRKTTQREICDTLSEYGYKWKEVSGDNHDHCSVIWNDIKNINENLSVDNVIISKNFEYWIGSERETKAFIAGLWKALSPRLKRYWKYLKKTNLEGQQNVFDEEFHEVFNKYDVEMQKQLGEVKE